ncbi:unnamed protein product [Rangifer tarandus platyrhynchus]|uniref:Uncharacterized protein n=2 Tax=Rangifer tarandus platyrhynchus TaxID=3082113 RepID=A0ABN8ZD14_RANTA|nr:unnamed protein product [Rangifer tarandus platyrhynchus]
MARPRRAPRRQRPPSCLTSRTTHEPPQRRERGPEQRSSGFLTPPEHITASASAKYAVLCDFDTPPQGHKLSHLQCHTDTRYTCHTLAQTFTNPASPAANAGRVTLSHAACGRDTDRAVFTHRQVTYTDTPIKPHHQHKIRRKQIKSRTSGIQLSSSHSPHMETVESQTHCGDRLDGHTVRVHHN